MSGKQLIQGHEFGNHTALTCSVNFFMAQCTSLSQNRGDLPCRVESDRNGLSRIPWEADTELDPDLNACISWTSADLFTSDLNIS